MTGIIDQAHTAKEDTEIASWEEQIDLAIIDAENKHRNPTLDDVKEELKNKGIINDYSQVDEEGTITTNEPSYEIVGKLDDYIPYIPEGLEIGSEVNYSPEGSYNWDADYYYSGTSTYNDTALNTSDSNYAITKWKVLEIDKENEIVKLVPTAPTTGTVTLGGAQGYNNAVKLLNDACSNLYGYGGKKAGISARSLNIEDIEYYMTDEALEEAHNYNNGNATYNTQTGSTYSKNVSYYPLIYAQEEKSVINKIKKETGLEKSEQREFINDMENNGDRRGRVQAESIQPYQTHWKKDSEFMKTAFKNFSEGNFYDLIIPNGTNTKTYWIASRCVGTSSNFCHFYVCYMCSGSVDAYYMFDSDDYCYYDNYAIFPIVSINSELIEGNSTSGYTVNVE